MNDAPVVTIGAAVNRIDIANLSGSGTAATPYYFEIVAANYRPAVLPLIVSDIDSVALA